MTTPTLALGVSAAGAKTVADLAAAVGALKTNLAGLASVATNGAVNLDVLVKELRDMRQELGATMQGIRTDLAAGMEKAFNAATAKAKQGADQLENEVKKGTARVRVAAKGIPIGNDLSLSISGKGVQSISSVAKMAEELRQLDGARTAAQTAMEATTDKLVYSWNQSLGRWITARTNMRLKESEEFSKYQAHMMVGSAKIEMARLAQAEKEEAATNKQVFAWGQSLSKFLAKRQEMREKEAAENAASVAKQAEMATKEAAAINARSAQVEAAYQAMSQRGQLRAMIRARAQLDQGISPELVGARFGTTALAGATVAPLGVLKQQLDEIGTKAPVAGNGMRRFTKELDDAHSAARGLASGFGAMWLTWGNIAPLLAGAALSHGFVQTVKMGAEVQNTMQVIRNLSQETDGAVAGLNAQMLELARTGPFGPREVAEAMKTLSLAGLNAKQVGASIKDVLNFAIAGDTSIERAADVMTSVSTAFGVSAEGFNYVGDVIAKTAAVSKASVESIGSAFKTASVVNVQYGASLEDVGVGLALLSNAGIQGTAAGTALRNMYVDILGRTPKVQKAFQAIGLSATFAFDTATGKARGLSDIFRDLDGALSKFDKVSQTRALQDIFSERGGKEAMVVLDALRQKAKETGTSVATELQRMGREINNANGFMATASASMALTPLNQMKSTVASLQATLVSTFDSLQPYIVHTAEQLKTVFNSPEFQNGIRNVVVLVGTLTQAFADNAGVLSMLLGAWVSFKAGGALAAVVISATQSLIGFASAARSAAAATGLITAAQAANTTATVAGAAATAGKATSLVTLLGVFGRFLPYVGAAITAWSLYSMWTDTAAKSNADYAGDTHASFIGALRAERDRLNEINEAKILGISLDEQRIRKGAQLAQQSIEAPVDAAKAKLISLRAQYATTPDGKPRDPGPFAANLIKAQEEEVERQETLATSRRREVQRNLESLESAARLRKEQELADIAKREKERIAGAAAYQLGAGGAAGSGKDLLRDNSLTTVSSLMKQRESVLKESYSNEQALLNAKHRGELISEGEYQAQNLKLTADYEQQSKAVVLASLTDMQKARDDEAARLAKVYKGPALQQALDNLNDTYRRLTSSANADLAKMMSETVQRQAMSVIQLDSEVKKLTKSNEDYWTKATIGANKEEALTRTRIASLGMSEEGRAAMEASTRVVEQHSLHMAQLQQEYDLAVKALSGFTAETERSGIVGIDATTKYEALQKQVAALAAAINGSADSITQLKDRAASNAALEVQARKYRQFADNFGSSLSDAIVNAGEDGGASIRRTLEQELLRKPFKMVIEALMKPVTDQLSGGVMGIVNSIIGGIGGGAGAAASSGVVSDVIPAIVGGIASADGGGYTGSGPRSGGLDGKGGFLSLLHPQETVIDHTKGQGSGTKVEIVINNYSGERVSQEERMDSRGNRRLELTIGDIAAGEARRPGSSSQQAMRQGFGVRPTLVGR